MALGEVISEFVPLTVFFQLFFICFFASAGVAIYFQDRYHMKQLFVSGFFAALLITGLVGVAVPPVTHMQKFSGAGPEEAEFYHVYLADDDGDEIRYDARAAEPILNTRLDAYAGDVVNEQDNETRTQSASFLLQQARDYRSEIQSGRPLLTHFKFPRHEIDYGWQPTEISQYGPFVELRIYRITYSTTEDGKAVDSYTKTEVYRYHMEGEE